MLVALLACGYHLRFNSNRTRSLLITSAVLALSLYVPAIIYFIIAGAVWQFKAVQREQKFPKPIIAAACSLIVLIILAPLAYGLLKQPGLWREYFGISAQFPHMLNFLKSAAAVPYGIFISAPRNPLYRLGRQPLLDVFAAVMLVLGCYTLIKHFRLDRLVLLIAIFVLATLYTAISGNYENNFILVPFVYFCIAIGIGTMLELWRKVFPHNPLAQSLSYGIIAVAVLISVNFQTRRYFIAWPHNPEIRAVFTLK